MKFNLAYLLIMIMVISSCNNEDENRQITNKREAQKREVRAALSNTFGFGGHNASVIFKKYQD